MELQRLRYFVAVTEAGGVSRAAARLKVAQPSISQQIRRLEDSIGRPLFDRQGRGMALTDAGRALLPRARRILAEVNEVLREQSESPGTSTSLAVGAIPTMAPYLLPQALAKLRKKLPACDLSVREDVTASLLEMLRDNQLDCAILSTPVEDEMIQTQVLGKEELWAVVPASWPNVGVGAGVGGSMLSVADLREHPAILLEDVHCLSQQVRAFCAARKVAPRVVCRMTQLGTVLELVSVGLGLSLVPEMAAAGDRSTMRRYLRLTSAKPTREIAVAWRAGRTRSHASLMLAGLIQEHLASMNASRARHLPGD